MCEVVNKKTSSFDVYIGRGSKWGNPFVLGKHGSREEVIEKYKSRLWELIQKGYVTKEELRALNGKRLGCFCKPLACHGDVIKDAVSWSLKK